MSLIRQITALIATLLVLALAGSLLTALPAARRSLEDQVRLKNADNAGLLALSLSQTRADPMTMELLMSAQFDTGHYRSLRLVDNEGREIFRRDAPGRESRAPAWFQRWMPVEPEAGIAQVGDGWRLVGRLELQSHVAYAHDALWDGALRTSGFILLLGAGAGLLAWAGVRALRRPLDATVAQARALQEGRFVTVPLPAVPELRVVGETMNTLVQRLRQVFDEQAAQVAALRQLAEHDPLTGLANRRHFLALLQGAIERAAAPAGASAPAAATLWLARLADLDGLNRRHGRAAADRLLREIAASLLRRLPPPGAAPADGRPAAFAGRLNGADLAIVLPPGADVQAQAETWLDEWRHVLQPVAADVAVSLGSADIDGLAPAATVLAAVDSALADAEASGPFRHVHRAAEAPRARAAEDWRRLLDRALAAGSDGGLRLAEFPVLDAQGRLAHLECPLRLRLEGGAANAAQWLSHALRSHRLPALDLRAADLALAASAADGLRRSVNVSAEALATPGFVDDLRERLVRAGSRARLLQLELPERALLTQRERLVDAARAWSACGASVGIEHAGGASEVLARLFDAGLGFVKIDRRHVRGIADDLQLRGFVAGLVALLHGMRLKVVAEGVDRPEDLATAWTLGFDAATGPAVRWPEGVSPASRAVDDQPQDTSPAPL